MQENLDVIISFVVVIVVLSMLLQIITEAIKNVLKLRWNVYEKFFMEKYDSYFKKKPSTGEKNSVRKKISNTRRKERKPIGSISQRFRSFHKTIVSLKDDILALKEALLRTKEQLVLSDDNEKEIQGLIISFTRRISPVLHKLQVVNFDDLFSIYLEHLSKVSKEGRNELKKLFDDFRNNLYEIENLEATEVSHIQDMKKHLIGEIDKICKSVSYMHKQVTEYYVSFSQKADTLLVDLENRYSRKIAWWTFCIGLILVVLINADSILIYKTLRNEPVVRSAIMKQAGKLTSKVTANPRSQRINALNDRINALKKDLEEHGNFNAEKYHETINEIESLSETIVNDADSFNRGQAKAGRSNQYLVALPYDLTRDQKGLIKLLKKHEKRVGTGQKIETKTIDEIEDTLDSALLRLSEDYFALQLGIIKSQKKLLYSTDLPLGWTMERLKGCRSGFWNIIIKLIGLLITAVFISFGAPFWNDILKSLFGLKNFLRKPETAGKIPG